MRPEPGRIHLACGDVRLAGWLNVDLASPLADLQLDLRQPMPFADESAAYLFSEHFIEHLTRPEALAFLAEAYRVLAPDGVLRISTPDLKFLAVSYLAGATGEWGEVWRPATPCALANEGMRCWGHQFLYDADELVAVLREARFRSLAFAAWRESADPVLAGLESRPFHNELIVEARKTGGPDFVCDSSAARANESRWLDRIHSTALVRLTSDRTIAEQARRIGELEQQIFGLERELAEQAARAGQLETELSALRRSWLGRLHAAGRRLRGLGRQLETP